MLSPSYLRNCTRESRERIALDKEDLLYRALERHIAYIEKHALANAEAGKTYVVSYITYYREMPAKYVRKWLTKHLKAYFRQRGFTCKRHGDQIIVSWRRVRKEKIQGEKNE